MAWKFLRGDEKPGGGLFGFLESAARGGKGEGGGAFGTVRRARDIGVETARFFPRGGVSIGETIGELTSPLLGLPRQQEINPRQLGPIGRFFLGSEPIQSFQRRQSGFQRALEERNIGPAGLLSAAGVGLAMGLEVTPFGAGRKSLSEQLVKAGTTKDVTKMLAGKLPDDVVQKIAPAIAQTKDPNVIGRIINKYSAPSSAITRTPPTSVISDITPYPVRELDISQRVFEQLPKTVKTKILRNQPLAVEDVAKLNFYSGRLGEAADQLSLSVLEDASRVPVKIAQNVAERTTKGGQIKGIIKGEQAISKELATMVKELSSQEPSKAARTLQSLTGRDTKEFRSFINILNSTRKKSAKTADSVEDFLFRPILELDAQANQAIRGLKQPVLDINKQLGKITNKDKDALRQILDGDVGAIKLADNPQAVEAYVGTMRNAYDDALKLINEQRRQAGLQLIPKRQDYFPHMKEMIRGEFFLRPLTSQDPDYIRRLSSSFGFAKERSGMLKKIEQDPFKVMDVYLAGTERQIASIVPSSRINGLIKVLDDVGAKDTNGVAGWSKWLKRINDDITGSASVDNILLRLQGRYAAGTIILNPGSTLKNLIQPALATGLTRKHAGSALYENTLASLRLLKDKNINKFLEIDGQESAYLQSAFSAMDLSRLAKKSVPQKIGDAFSKTFYATQLSGQRFIVNAFYRQNLAKGLGKTDALKIAERQAETMLPSRAPGTLPAVTRGGTLSRAASLFQTEVIAQAEAMVQATTRGVFSTTKKETATNIAGLAVLGNLFNEGYEELFPGQRPAPDPIFWIIDSIKKGASEESVAAGTLQFGKNMLGQLPFIGSYFSDVSRSPLSIPIGEVVSKTFSPFNPESSVRRLVAGEGGSTDIARIGRESAGFAGRGGKALFRAGEGTLRFLQGGVEDRAGDRMFDIQQNPANLTRVVLGGSYNVKSAQEYFDRGLSKSQNEIILRLQRQGATKEQVTATKSFYQNLKIGSSSKDNQLKKFDEAYEGGDSQKALQIAEDYNEQLAQSLDKWFEQYSKYGTDDLKDEYKSRKINPRTRVKSLRKKAKEGSRELKLVP